MDEGGQKNFLEQEGKITSPSTLKYILKERGLHPRRSLGQHFLVDENILHKILAAAMLDKNDLVIDIGSGPGALSLMLAKMVAGVIAIEWDRGLAAFLREQANNLGYNHLYVIEGDVRRLNLGKICCKIWGKRFSADGNGRHIKVVANLPYYLTTPLLFQLLQEKEPEIKLLVLMVQLEVAQRIIAGPGKKDYGVLSLLCRYYTEPEFLFKVSRNVFYPPPAVDSAVVALRVLPQPPFKVFDEGIFWEIVKAVFQKRRKILSNALNGVQGLNKKGWERLLIQAKISPSARGESLSLEEFANVANLFYNNKKSKQHFC
ncbi:MAG: 16S rRNA (adenine(1518)-N(6)/adenine(1519)-N(6))-dimethyltransferase RsmA [Dethiobacteria bacterium]